MARTYPLGRPFMIVATQNPIEQEGTYRLPEAQLDRFFFKLNVDYPTLDEEVAILDRAAQGRQLLSVDNVQAVMNVEELERARALVDQVHLRPEARALHRQPSWTAHGTTAP